MGRTPLFTGIAVLTLAVTIAAVSTVLTLSDALLFRHPAVVDAGGLLRISAVRGQRLDDTDPLSHPDYLHFRERTRTLSGLAAHYSTSPLFLTTERHAQEVNGAVVSADFFPVLGLKPALGRFFTPDEDRVPDRDRVAVLGHDLWRGWYAGDPDVIGTSLKINDVPFTIIGVAPADFHGMRESPSKIYIPTMMLSVGYRWCDDALAVDCTILHLVGRLAEGRVADDVRAEFATLVPQHWSRGDEAENSGITVYGMREIDRPGADVGLATLLGWVAGVLLLVCCANLAGLLIARGNARVRELAVRTSLGATGRRLVRQLLTESLLLALLGGTLGIAISIGLTRLFEARFYTVDYAGRPIHFDFSLQPRVILAVLGISLVAGVLFGLLPALRSTRLDVVDALKRQSGSVSGRSRLGNWLVGAQAAAAVALVAIATLLSASAADLVAGTSYDSSHVALIRMRPRLLRYSPEQAQAFTRRVVAQLEARPDVESVSLVGTGAALSGSQTRVSLPGSPGKPLRVGYIEIGPRYFETLGIPLLRGRDFGDRDSVEAAPVAIVSRTMASRLWPGDESLGQAIVIGDRPHEVVGIVEDASLQSRQEGVLPYVYRPYWQNPGSIDARLQIRVTGDPATTLPSLVREVHEVDPAVPLAETVPLTMNLEGGFKVLRMSATSVGYAGALVLLLTAIGLYGTLAYSVARRTREIGIRLAIGARPAGVLATITREGMTVVLVGIVSGLGIAVGASRLLGHLLYGSASADLRFYALAATVVVAVGLLACWIPARRAANVDPIVALRDE